MDTYSHDTYWRDTYWNEMCGMMLIEMHGCVRKRRRKFSVGHFVCLVVDGLLVRFRASTTNCFWKLEMTYVATSPRHRRRWCFTALCCCTVLMGLLFLSSSRRSRARHFAWWQTFLPRSWAMRCRLQGLRLAGGPRKSKRSNWGWCSEPATDWTTWRWGSAWKSGETQIHGRRQGLLHLQVWELLPWRAGLHQSERWSLQVSWNKETRASLW